MELSPSLYRYLVRPKWFTDRYIEKKLKVLLSDFDFKNKSIIDFGCGIGSNSSLFNSKGYLGIDCDKRRIDYACKRFNPYTFEVFDGVSLPSPTNSIDYIIIIAVLHHINSNDILKYIDEFKRVLKPNGKILIIEPCFLKDLTIRNNIMKFLDKGKFIRTKIDYIELFNKNIWDIKIVKSFTKCLVYNEIFYIASIKK